ncbi:MAG: LacI family transcriptional regulator [Spartobacteria bacterium]|nr:LacI family transcriptional regulator [Spartobacteria bacterium]
MAITVADIAKQANVSPATVSLVLNGKPGVGSATRDRVIKIAMDHDYKGLAKGSGLKKRNAIMLALITKHGHILNETHKAFIADYITGADMQARQQGYTLEICTFTSFDPNAVLELVNSSSVGAVIVLGTELDAGDVEFFLKSTVPSVFMDIIYTHLPFDFVDMNNDSSVYNAISHLYENGHTEIGIINGLFETSNFFQRYHAYRKALNLFNLSYNSDFTFCVDSTYENTYTTMLERLKEKPKLPTAFFCVNDVIALGCMRALKESGYAIPDDISVVGFDNIAMSAMSEPPLTTIDVSKIHIGRNTVKLALQRIDEGDGMPYEKIMIGGELIERNSVRNLNTDESQQGE